MNNSVRIGFGYDVHQFEDGGKLMLGGVEIPFGKGLKGHSDADVLLHAICDSILGALSLGDIGKHFPDTDRTYKNIDSKILLKKSYELVKSKKYVIGNIDSTIVIERPKIAPHVEMMKSVISGILECSDDQISIKATTSEKMGFVGNEQGVKAYASALLIFKGD
ncbi:MAG: 2-C-methyl-D-erythritol 2,4-cyclodiphosphate synthase [Melioribacteraceae bacterium]|nr:2-C-methyl-D-erythritol 2,4-cyclodiphosphate synthase [Melioribacteraceae bacterium]